MSIILKNYLTLLSILKNSYGIGKYQNMCLVRSVVWETFFFSIIKILFRMIQIIEKGQENATLMMIYNFGAC